MKYDFDKIINRHGTNAMSTDGYKDYLFAGIDDIRFPCADDAVLSMWIADMAFAVAPEILAAIKCRLDKEILGYTLASDQQYEGAFLNWTSSRYGFEFDPEHLVYAPGIVPALFDLIKYLCAKDDKVIIFTPSYGFFKHAADKNNNALLTCDLIVENGDCRMDFDRFKQLAGDEKAKVCILCNPHNPSGRVWSEAELKSFAQICFDNGIKIISDEIHCDLLRRGQVFTPLAKLYPGHKDIITCMSASKTFNLAGLMFANLIIADQSLRTRWNEEHIPLTNPLSQAGAHSAYTKGKDWLQALCSYLDENFLFLQNYLNNHLPLAIFKIPESTYLAWIDLSNYFDGDCNLTLFFAENAGVLLEGGNMFVANADGHIRINIACPRSKLVMALDKIKVAIKNIG
jgi:cystathionine beta-lyase